MSKPRMEPFDAVIGKLRDRARQSARRAGLFLILLFITVFVGLGYFIGIPLYQEGIKQRANLDRAREEAAINATERELALRFTTLRDRAVALSRGGWVKAAGIPDEDLHALAFWDADTGVAVGRNGTALRTDDRGETWQTVELDDPLSETFDLFHVRIGQLGAVVMGYGDQSAPIFSAKEPGLEGWVPVEHSLSPSTYETYENFVTYGSDDLDEKDSRVTVRGTSDFLIYDAATGWRTVARMPLLLSQVEGNTTSGWSLSPQESQASLYAQHFPTPNFGIAVGGLGEILRTEDGGLTWQRDVSGTDEELTAVWAWNRDAAIVTGHDGIILRYRANRSDEIAQATDTPDLRRAFLNVVPPKVTAAYGPGSAGDACATFPSTNNPLEMAMQGNDDGEMLATLRALDCLSQERTGLDLRRAAHLASVTVSRNDQAFDTAATLAQAADTPEDRARAMTALEIALAQGNTTEDWWRYSADRIPAGILILFLLATLGSLYRYNVRIAGFYNGRADVLELLGPELNADRLTMLSGLLAADKVEFKDVKTPTDIAGEVAKEFAAKVKL